MRQFTMNGVVETINNGIKSVIIENYYVTNKENFQSCLECI